jgi:hypothetical protein
VITTEENENKLLRRASIVGGNPHVFARLRINLPASRLQGLLRRIQDMILAKHLATDLYAD